MRLTTLALTPGEPAGIGPDLCVMLAQRPCAAQLVTIADPEMLRRRADLLGLPLRLTHFRADRTEAALTEPGCLTVLPLKLREQEICGQLNPANAGYVLDSLRTATEGCLNQTFDALVTGPVHKGIINQSGFPFTGHTEFLAEICQGAGRSRPRPYREGPMPRVQADLASASFLHSPHPWGSDALERPASRDIGTSPVMLLATEGLRVALVTTHLPLAKVSGQITVDRVERITRILHRGLQIYFGLQDPHILVCGLNPHAGEDGHLGREEIEVIEPVLARLRQEGMQLTGPLPADTLFTPKYLQQADAVLAMYHDQGLPVLKHLGFGRAVNITLGLPIIRTSVDHGTALELAGSGKARVNSLEIAVKTAIEMVAASKNDTMTTA